MEDVLIYICVFVVAFILGGRYGWGLRERVAQRIVDGIIQEAEKKHEANSDKIQIVVEKHKDSLYIYNKENNQFMAQGCTMEELNDALESRFPGKKFACSEEHLQMIKELQCN